MLGLGWTWLPFNAYGLAIAASASDVLEKRMSAKNTLGSKGLCLRLVDRLKPHVKVILVELLAFVSDADAALGSDRNRLRWIATLRRLRRDLLSVLALDCRNRAERRKALGLPRSDSGHRLSWQISSCGYGISPVNGVCGFASETLKACSSIRLISASASVAGSTGGVSGSSASGGRTSASKSATWIKPRWLRFVVGELPLVM